MIKPRFLLLCLILVLLDLEFCNASNETYKIKVGVSPVLSSSGIFLAYEKGYFKDQGLDVDIIYFKSSGAPMTVLLGNGSLDIGGGNISAGLWAAINSGVNIKLVADKGHIGRQSDYIGLIVRKDLVDSLRYKSFNDLKGLRMAITAYGVSQQIAAEKFLGSAGLKLNDVIFEKMDYANMNVALKNKDIDATIQLEPYLTEAQLNGAAVKVSGVYDVYPNQQSAAIIYSAQFIAKHRDLAEKFMIAYLKGVREYNKAFIEGERRKETISLLKKHVKIESNEVWDKMIPVGLDSNGFLNKESLAEDAKWYKKYGFIEKLPDIDKAVDNSFVEKALNRIGRYE